MQENAKRLVNFICKGQLPRSFSNQSINIKVIDFYIFIMGRKYRLVVEKLLVDDVFLLKLDPYWLPTFIENTSIDTIEVDHNTFCSMKLYVSFIKTFNKNFQDYTSGGFSIEELEIFAGNNISYKDFEGYENGFIVGINCFELRSMGFIEIVPYYANVLNNRSKNIYFKSYVINQPIPDFSYSITKPLWILYNKLVNNVTEFKLILPKYKCRLFVGNKLYGDYYFLQIAGKYDSAVITFNDYNNMRLEMVVENGLKKTLKMQQLTMEQFMGCENIICKIEEDKVVIHMTAGSLKEWIMQQLQVLPKESKKNGNKLHSNETL